MDYKIIEARIEYKGNQLYRITVLVDMSAYKKFTDVRAIFATTSPRNGYMHIQPGAILTHELLQEVAGYGLETVDRDEIFPNWKSKIQ